MDEGTKEVVQILAEEALRPATSLIDNIIGVLGGCPAEAETPGRAVSRF